jgi:pSer/pThr/pTyr-binding forkhead associated (FHA) protein
MGVGPREAPLRPAPTPTMGDTIIGDSNLGKRLEKIPRKEVLQLSYGGRNIPIVGVITIGRGKDNSIQVDDVMASRHHAAVQKIRNDYFVRDLQSTNGTFVNGAQVPDGKYVRLQAGDVVKIGRTELSLQ